MGEVASQERSGQYMQLIMAMALRAFSRKGYTCNKATVAFHPAIFGLKRPEDDL